MVNIIQQTLVFWNILLIDINETIPETKREKIIKTLKTIGSKLLLLNSIIFNFVTIPLFHENDSSNIIDNQKILWGFGVFIGIVTMTCRHILLVKSTQKIKELTSGPLAGNYTVEQQSKYELSKKLRMMNRYLKTLKIYLVSSQVLQIFQVIIYLVIYGRESSLTTDFPFDASRMEIYPFAFLWTEASSVILVVVMIVTDSLLCYMATVATIELDIWRVDFKDLKGLSEAEKVKKLPELVDRHNSIFNTVNDVEDIFSSYFLVSLILNSVSVCTNLFQVVAFSDFSNKFLNILLSVLMLVLIGMICFFGQMLLDACERVRSEIYDCGWEEFKDVKLRKMIWFMQMRSQKDVKLTFMQFYDVKMEHFRGVVASTYAYFTLLLKLKMKA